MHYLAEDYENAADRIKRFIEGEDELYDWDDFISVPFRDKFLNSISLACAALPDVLKSSNKQEYTNTKGFEILRDFETILRKIAGELRRTSTR